jgi:hypothetical protein
MNPRSDLPTIQEARALALASPKFCEWRPHDFVGDEFRDVGETWHNRGDDLQHDGNKSDAGLALEKHYRPDELAEIWGLSDDSIRTIFADEPGVLCHGDNKGSRVKRRYITMRIPESVAVRVHRKLSAKPLKVK